MLKLRRENNERKNGRKNVVRNRKNMEKKIINTKNELNQERREIKRIK